MALGKQTEAAVRTFVLAAMKGEAFPLQEVGPASHEPLPIVPVSSRPNLPDPLQVALRERLSRLNSTQVIAAILKDRMLASQVGIFRTLSDHQKTVFYERLLIVLGGSSFERFEGAKVTVEDIRMIRRKGSEASLPELKPGEDPNLRDRAQHILDGMKGTVKKYRVAD